MEDCVEYKMLWRRVNEGNGFITFALEPAKIIWVWNSEGVSNGSK